MTRQEQLGERAEPMTTATRYINGQWYEFELPTPVYTHFVKSERQALAARDALRSLPSRVNRDVLKMEDDIYDH